MGQPPPLTVVPKRRYDTGPQIVPPRPLAPSVDANEVDRDPSGFQANKPTKSSPPQFGSGPQKLSTLAQAEPVPSKVLHQNTSQGSAGSTVRSGIQPQQQRASQGLQGPRVGFFTDDRLRPTLQPQPAAQSQQLQQQPTRQQPQPDNLSHKPLLDQSRVQNLQDPLQIQDRSNPPDHPSASARYQQPVQVHQPSISHQVIGTNRQINAPSQARIAPSHTAEVEIRPRVTIHQQLQSQHLSHHNPRQEQQRMEISTNTRFDTYGAPCQTTMQSPANPRLPLTFSPPQEAARPSSVPAGPPAQQPPKRSNIMSILNDEPAEPQARKRPSDSGPAAPTPPPQSPAGGMYQQPVQQYTRREGPTTEPQHPLQQYHHRTSLGQVTSHHQAQQAQEGPSNWATVAQRTSLERQPTYQQQRAESPRMQPTYAQQASRAPLQSMPRTHAPTPPPPFGHSRASSFASLQSQQQQQKQQLPPSSQATPVLQPSPYAQIHPQQPMHSHHQQQHSQHQHQHSQPQHQPPQAPAQPQQQPHRGSGATSLFHHQYMRQQEAIQQQEASLQRQLKASRPDIRQYQENLLRLEANEQARRDEAARRTFTPPVYGHHGGYGPSVDGHSRGYEDRR